MFEIKSSDLAARIGKIHTNSGSFETPTLLPVLHPVNQLIDTEIIKNMGFEAVMTNSYITWQKYGTDLADMDIHSIVEFNGPIMTDSGGYQILEYGKVDVEEIEIARFQENIKSDLCNVLDKPTSLKDDWKDARNSVLKTLDSCENTLNNIEHKSAWMGPIQGGKFLDLVEFSAKRINGMNFDMYTLGSPTEIMESYDYRLLAKMIITAKKNISAEKPFHLFGLGHPAPLSMAVALGCDTFDSASYILYAKHGRYFTENGTRNIDELEYLPCICEICKKYSVREIRSMEKIEKTKTIGIHNLWALWKEIMSTRQAIKEGRLWELVGTRARTHPKMWDAFKYLSENLESINNFQSRFKSKGIFLSSVPDNKRPELYIYQTKMMELFNQFVNQKVIIIPVTRNRPLFYDKKLQSILEKYKNNAIIGYIIPPFGFVPYQLTDIYPISHYEISETMKYDNVQIDAMLDLLMRQFKILDPESISFIKDSKLNQKIINFVIRILKPNIIIEKETNIYTSLDELLQKN